MKARLILRHFDVYTETAVRKTVVVEIPDAEVIAGKSGGKDVYYNIEGGEWLPEEASDD